MMELDFTPEIFCFFPVDASTPEGKDNRFTSVLSDPEPNKTFHNALVFVCWMVPTIVKLVDCSSNRISQKAFKFTSLTPEEYNSSQYRVKRQQTQY
jgi:hypothetical protein